MRVCLLVLISAVFTVSVSTASLLKINRGETIVFFGDSITVQGPYTYPDYIEAYLLARLPKHKLDFYNFSLAGGTASQGSERFTRNVVPQKPTLIFVNFAMNDGNRQSPYQHSVLKEFIAAQRSLAKQIAACGAREVLLTSSCFDYKGKAQRFPIMSFTMKKQYFTTDPEPGLIPQYNATLSYLAQGVLQLGRELNIPVIDIFHPMLDIQRAFKKDNPTRTFIPDAIHPNHAGHLIMAYLVLRQIEAPRQVARIRLAQGKIQELQGAKIESFRADSSLIDFKLTLPFLPLYPSPKGRYALALVPFQKELNDFVLQVSDWSQRDDYHLLIDDRLVAVVSGTKLANGLDLGLLDSAPWNRKGRQFVEAVNAHARRKRELWSYTTRVSPKNKKEILAFDKFVKFSKQHIRGLAQAMRKHVQASAYHVSLLPGNPWHDRSRLPFVIDGWEGSNPEQWSALGRHTRIVPTESHHTQGRQAVKVYFELFADDVPGISSVFNPPLDLSAVRKVAVDVYTPPDAVSRKNNLSIVPGIQFAEDTTGAFHDPIPLLARGWNTLVIDLDDAHWIQPPYSAGPLARQLLKRVTGWEITLTAATSKTKGFIILDNLRALE